MSPKYHHRIIQQLDSFSGIITRSTVVVLALTIIPWLTMATDFSSMISLFASLFAGESSPKFNSVELKSSDCSGLSMDKYSSK